MPRQTDADWLNVLNVLNVFQLGETFQLPRGSNILEPEKYKGECGLQWFYSRTNGGGRVVEKPNNAKKRLGAGISHLIIFSVENAYSLGD